MHECSEVKKDFPAPFETQHHNMILFLFFANGLCFRRIWVTSGKKTFIAFLLPRGPAL